MQEHFQLQKKILSSLLIGAFVFGVSAANIQPVSANSLDKVKETKEKYDKAKDKFGQVLDGDSTRKPAPPDGDNSNRPEPPKDSNGKPMAPPDSDNSNRPEPPKDSSVNHMSSPINGGNNHIMPPRDHRGGERTAPPNNNDASDNSDDRQDRVRAYRDR
mgnify:CR=1 FL=1